MGVNTDMAKILSICTYPVSVPRHGGQIRIDAIHQVYRNAGHTVRHLALYQHNLYPEEPEGPWNVHLSWPFINEVLAKNGSNDVNAADFLLKDANARERVFNLIRGFEPDIIQLEQCWMWPFIKSMQESSDRLPKVKILYSSQNVEYQLLRSAAREGKPPATDAAIALLQRMEMDLVKNSDLVIAVSKLDADIFHPAAREIVIACNGIWPSSANTGQEYWSKRFEGQRIALFVGSAHPPNASGFMKLLGPSLGYLSPTETIVVVGGVCNLLHADQLFRESLGINLARVALVGVQDPGGLSTLIDMADVVLVPIIEGGGTNIKMAEALYNRKPIVCTPKATRGYDAFLDMPSVFVQETADGFKRAMTSILRRGKAEHEPVSRSQARRLETLLWTSTLAGLPSVIDRLIPSLFGDNYDQDKGI